MKKVEHGPHPKPVSWRPKTQAMRDFYLELGGARWLKRVLSELMAAKKP